MGCRYMVGMKKTEREGQIVKKKHFDTSPAEISNLLDIYTKISLIDYNPYEYFF